MNAYHKLRGISRVEVIIILICIGVLAVIFRSLARGHNYEPRMRTHCMSNQRQIGMALLMSTEEHNFMLPAKLTWAGDSVTSSHTQWVMDLGLDPKSLICPEDHNHATLSYALAEGLAGISLNDVSAANATDMLLTADAKTDFWSIHPHAEMEKTGMDAYPTFRGITRVESLVILACLGVVVVILWPSKYCREKAPVTQCLSNLRQIAEAATMYAQDNNGKLPEKLNGYGNTFSSANTQWVSELGLCRNKILICPVDTKHSTLSYGLAADVAGGSIYDYSTPSDTMLFADALTMPGSDPPHADGLIFSAADIATRRHDNDFENDHVFNGAFLDGHAAYCINSMLTNAVDATSAPVALTAASNFLYQGANHLFTIDVEKETVYGSAFTSPDAGHTEHIAFSDITLSKSGQGITIQAPGGPVTFTHPKTGVYYTLFVRPKNATCKVAALLKKGTLTITNDN